MSYFNIVAETNENTVVTEYKPERQTDKGYQSEVAFISKA
jgi:type I restriction enzyme R subunit